MSTPDDLEHRIEKLHVTTRAETDEHILEDAFAELEISARGEAAAGGRCVFLKVIRNRTKELVTVAALVLIVFALFLSAPAAKAVTLAQIYQAVEKVTNVCISKFRAGHKEPYQQIWISTLMRVRLAESKKQIVLLNLQNWTKKEINKSIGSSSETSIQSNMRKKYEDLLSGSFGLIPFSDISIAIKEAEWNRIDDKSITSTIAGTEVYELTWSKQIDNFNTEYYKWRVFVDIQTNLPIKTERYRKTNANSEYALILTYLVTYPTDDEIKVRIREIFSEVEQQKVESEDFNNPETTQIDTGTEQ